MEPGDGQNDTQQSRVRVGEGPVGQGSESDVIAKTDGGGSNSSPIPVPIQEFTSLSGFQRDILYIIAGLETPKGLEIKEELEQIYTEEINHGRLYPNLDTLADGGFIDKISLDGRSNGYELSETGRAHLLARQQWEDGKLSQSSSGESIEAFDAEEEVSDTTESVEEKPDANSSHNQRDTTQPNIQEQLKSDLSDFSGDSGE